jgi:hypothetical protein
MKKLNMKIFLLFIITIFINSFSYAQNQTIEPPQRDQVKKNSVYIEGLGSAGAIYNLSYDRIVYQEEQNKFTIAMGMQFLSHSPYNDNDWIGSISPQINYLQGIKHHLELGIGFTYLASMSNVFIREGIWGVPLRIGYRYQRDEGGLFLKIAYTPIIIDKEIISSGFLPVWGGLALGWTF